MSDTYPARARSSRRPNGSAPKTDLKKDLLRILENEDLSRKVRFVESLAEESSSEITQVAAALLCLLEKQRNSQSRDRWQAGGRAPRQTGRPRFGSSDRRPPRTRGGSGPMTKYRIEVGRSHGVGPGQIVGAIANESNLNGTDIGGIDIQTHFSTVDLPSDLSSDTVRELGKVQVAGQALRLSKWERGGDSRLREQPKRFQRKRGGKPTWKKTRKRAQSTD